MKVKPKNYKDLVKPIDPFSTLDKYPHLREQLKELHINEIPDNNLWIRCVYQYIVDACYNDPSLVPVYMKNDSSELN